MKPTLLLLLTGLTATGCAIGGAIQSRARQNSVVYASLTPAMRVAVDRGQLVEGMPKDAVVIAWGRPAEVVQVDAPGGPYEMWVYHGTTWRSREFPTCYYFADPYRPMPNLVPSVPLYETVRVACEYVKGEVTFRRGLVQRWSVRPAPRS